jgi:drug/metabolite transporter (DMT)-like permease
MSAITTGASQDDDGFAQRALPLLLVVGSLLAISVLLSKVAAGLHASMLTYLAFAMGGSGVVLAFMNGGVRRDGGSFAALAGYSLVAGALMALGSALGYLTVHRVGAAFIALALAFPPVLTWLLSLVLGLERFDSFRVGGLMISLAGGVALAVSKGVGTPSDIGAILVACAMPAVLAVGNVFRTRCWPTGASPRELAGAMLICGAALTLPFALYFEGTAGIATLLQPRILGVLLFAIVIFVAQYTAFFRLQQIAGPVYMSQIGSVAAIVGCPIAVVALGEHLPAGFSVSATLIVLGLALFQYRTTRLQ